jgi:hypothetical protein
MYEYIESDFIDSVKFLPEAIGILSNLGTYTLSPYINKICFDTGDFYVISFWMYF